MLVLKSKPVKPPTGLGKNKSTYSYDNQKILATVKNKIKASLWVSFLGENQFFKTQNLLRDCRQITVVTLNGFCPFSQITLVLHSISNYEGRVLF